MLGPVLKKFGINVREQSYFGNNDALWFYEYLTRAEKQGFDRTYRPRVGKAILQTIRKYRTSGINLERLLEVSKPATEALLAKAFDRFESTELSRVAGNIGINTWPILRPIYLKYENPVGQRQSLTA